VNLSHTQRVFGQLFTIGGKGLDGHGELPEVLCAQDIGIWPCTWDYGLILTFFSLYRAKIRVGPMTRMFRPCFLNLLFSCLFRELQIAFIGFTGDVRDPVGLSALRAVLCDLALLSNTFRKSWRGC